MVYPLSISHRQARMFLFASIVLVVAAIVVAFTADRFTSHYGILTALVAGLSVGGGLLFSDGIFYITERGGVAKLIFLGLLSVISTVLVVVAFPVSQKNSGGVYYLNLTGLIIGVIFMVSLVALLHTAIIYASTRRRDKRYKREVDS